MTIFNILASRGITPTLNIFVSFEFDKDNDLKNSFYDEARLHTPHRVRDCSLKESYEDKAWKDKARAAIRECDVVVVLVGQDTHNAQGVIVETDMARSMNKPIIQIRSQGSPYNGLPHLGKPIARRWKTINRKLDEIMAGRR